MPDVLGSLSEEDSNGEKQHSDVYQHAEKTVVPSQTEQPDDEVHHMLSSSLAKEQSGSDKAQALLMTTVVNADSSRQEERIRGVTSISINNDGWKVVIQVTVTFTHLKPF